MSAEAPAPAPAAATPRPAFYALAAGGWRDYVTLLHLPYTAWHLSYVAIGAALAPELDAERLGWGLLAFFLGLGVGVHALDELNGRPLRTAIPSPLLVALAGVSLAGAAAIGAVAALEWTGWLLPFVAFGVFIAVAYSLELFGGFFHSDLWFALAWGAFPLLTAYVGASGTIRAEALLAAAAAALVSAAQRSLSMPARTLRRRVRRVSGEIEHGDGHVESIDAQTLRAAPEAALRFLSLGMVALAAALVTLRLS